MSCGVLIIYVGSGSYESKSGCCAGAQARGDDKRAPEGGLHQRRKRGVALRRVALSSQGVKNCHCGCLQGRLYLSGMDIGRVVGGVWPLCWMSRFSEDLLSFSWAETDNRSRPCLVAPMTFKGLKSCVKEKTRNLSASARLRRPRGEHSRSSVEFVKAQTTDPGDPGPPILDFCQHDTVHNGTCPAFAQS